MELTCQVGQRDSYPAVGSMMHHLASTSMAARVTYLHARVAGLGLQLGGSGVRPAHGIGCDSLSSRSGESGLLEAWDPASPELAPLHEQAPLKQAVSQVAVTRAGPLCNWLQPLMTVLNRLIAS
jgi:hypothetical protein